MNDFDKYHTLTDTCIERLRVMVTMLHEIAAGEWAPTCKDINPHPWGLEIDLSRKDHFNMEVWLSSADDDDDTGECGYSACAIGHAMLDERFNALGLRISRLFNRPTYECGSGGVDERECDPWESLRLFFEFKHEAQAQFLFHPDGYSEYYAGDPDPGDVADRIEAYMHDPSIADQYIRHELIKRGEYDDE